MIRSTLRRDRDAIPDELKDLSRWPSIDITCLDDESAERTNRLTDAVRAYMQGLAVHSIAAKAGISRQELHRVVRRCLAEHPDGRIWGFRACLSHRHQRPHRRLVSIDGVRQSQRGGAAGALTLLFEQHPHIQQMVDKWFLNQLEKELIHESRMPVKAIHKRFLDACRAAGLTIRHYPFNMNHRARRALASYLRRLYKTHPKAATKARHGAEVARRLVLAAADADNAVTRPYERVEFDGHHLDIFCTIDLPNPYGGVHTVTLDRLWLLAIKDVFTRVILGYVISFNAEYTAEDVLRCIKHAVTPWSRLTLTIPGLAYPGGSGLPSGRFPQCAWALWDELWFDNAKANLANAVRTTLTRVIGCAINAGPVSTPQRRPHIERFFQTLEENGFHRLPSTTGSGPNDSRRTQPEAAALRYHFSYQHLIELLDVMIARYNAEPHAGLGHRSPLDMLEYHLVHEEAEMRTLPETKRQSLALLNLRVVRRIRGDLKQGKCPYVEYEGVRYYNDVLRRSPDLIGEKLTLLVDPEDLRCLTGYLDDGQEFGILTAHGFWSRSPHSLTVRKAINRLRIRKMIFYTDSDDPVMVYLDYKNHQAVTNKQARGQVAKLQTTLNPEPSSRREKDYQPMAAQRRETPELYTPVKRKTRLY